MKNEKTIIILLIIGIFLMIFSCSQKDTFNKKIIIQKNFGIDEQDKFFLTNDDLFANEIISNIQDLVREMNIKNSSAVMIDLQGKDCELAKQIIFEHLASNGIEQSKINFTLNETQSDTTIIQMLIK